MKKFLFLVFVCVVIALPAPVPAAEPTDTLQLHIDEVVSILKDPQYQTDAQKDQQREKIWKIIRQIFDFERISKLSLGKYWKDFNPKQLKEFTDLFTDLLGDTYLKKIQGEYKNEKVNYLSQEIGSDANSDKAQVKTEIVRENIKIPVDYSLWNNKGAWRIYDVKIEGVSLVKNYRNQFQKILLNKMPDNLIEKLKNKLEE
ncbi:MAG: hypothetical protein BWK80_62800 [Desulfobacteraceae bacterium IS3]|nr:MAG: hypothetical protein BWK80_62800 [Desulfobacteraceae bacterium IS3]